MALSRDPAEKVLIIQVVIESLQPQLSDLVAMDRWAESIGVSRTTLWRWRKRGLIRVANIAGRLYVSRAEVRRFEARVIAGEFAAASTSGHEGAK